jgi:hypothetical protein
MKLTTLLVAAAALAAGIIASKAQVYSQNVVGYANVPTTGGNEYAITVPFKVGVSNGANEVWPLVGGQPSLPDYSEVLIWNGTGFVGYFSDSGSSTLWDDVNFTQGTPAPELPVGQGFFLIPNSTTTNTFVGTVAVNVGTSNNVTLVGGNEYLVAPAVPYGGSVTNGNSTTFAGGPDLSSLQGLPDYSEILVWNGTGYVGYFSDSGSSTLWDDVNFTQGVTPPVINVAQGFFLIPNNTFTWSVGL